MSTDLQYTEEKGLDLSETGDYAAVHGDENARQQIILAVLASIGGFGGGPVTQTRIEEYTTDVKTALRESDHVDSVRFVDAEVVTDEEVELTIHTASEEFAVTVDR